MVALDPVPKIWYVTTLGLNGAGSLAKPAPGLVRTVRPKNPWKRSTQNAATATTNRMTSGTQRRLSTFIVDFPTTSDRRHWRSRSGQRRFLPDGADRRS